MTWEQQSAQRSIASATQQLAHALYWLAPHYSKLDAPYILEALASAEEWISKARQYLKDVDKDGKCGKCGAEAHELHRRTDCVKL